ncbi:uncharacterized protein V1510DRAFT_185660, partial [Dipodascopsis tothii]|uniref:uncharacterized protein n=1 Tax=Dipodascopsis tothii TaxID=44089 RepID=UPI0034CEE06F
MRRDRSIKTRNSTGAAHPQDAPSINAGTSDAGNIHNNADNARRLQNHVKVVDEQLDLGALGSLGQDVGEGGRKRRRIRGRVGRQHASGHVGLRKRILRQLLLALLEQLLLLALLLDKVLVVHVGVGGGSRVGVKRIHGQIGGWRRQRPLTESGAKRRGQVARKVGVERGRGRRLGRLHERGSRGRRRRRQGRRRGRVVGLRHDDRERLGADARGREHRDRRVHLRAGRDAVGEAFTLRDGMWRRKPDGRAYISLRALGQWGT